MDDNEVVAELSFSQTDDAHHHQYCPDSSSQDQDAQQQQQLQPLQQQQHQHDQFHRRNWTPFIELQFAVDAHHGLLPQVGRLMVQSGSDHSTIILYDCVYATKARATIRHCTAWNDLFAFTNEEMERKSAIRRIINPLQIVGYSEILDRLKPKSGENGKEVKPRQFLRPLICIFRYQIIQAWRYILHMDDLVPKVDAQDGPHLKSTEPPFEDLWGGKQSNDMLRIILFEGLCAWKMRHPLSGGLSIAAKSKSAAAARSLSNGTSSPAPSYSSPMDCGGGGDALGTSFFSVEPDQSSSLNDDGDSSFLQLQEHHANTTPTTANRRGRGRGKKSASASPLVVRNLQAELDENDAQQAEMSSPKKRRSSVAAKRSSAARKGSDNNTERPATPLSARIVSDFNAQSVEFVDHSASFHLQLPQQEEDAYRPTDIPATTTNTTSQIDGPISNQRSTLTSSKTVPKGVKQKAPSSRASKNAVSTSTAEQDGTVNAQQMVPSSTFTVRTWSEMTYILPKQLLNKPSVGPFTLPSLQNQAAPKRIVIGGPR